MKNGVAFILLVVLLMNTSCAFNYRLKYPSSIGYCEIRYMEGTLDIEKGKRGGLILYDDRMRICVKEQTLDIPYNNIQNCRIADKIGDPNLRIPGVFYRSHTPQKMLPGFWESLLWWIPIIGIIVLTVLLLEWSEDYDFLSFEFISDEKVQIALFKVRDKELKSIASILREKAGLA